MPDPYFSEVKFLGAGKQDFVEVVVAGDTDVSNIEFIVYNPDGTVRTINELGTVDANVAGRDVYSVDAAESETFNGVHKNGALALVVDGNVVQFISFESTVTATEGPASGMSSTALGATGRGESFESIDAGQSYYVNDTPSAGTIPCFLKGTRLLTPRGYRRIENLRPGDFVHTEDNGPCRVQWIGERTLSFDETQDEKHKPLRVPADAFGENSPDRETFVSPNHLLMIEGPICEFLFDRAQVFVAAKHLIGHFGIGPCPVALPIHYVHVLLSEHQVVNANGLLSESLFPGDMIRHNFTEPLPALSKSRYNRARRVLKKKEVTVLFEQMAAQKLESPATQKHASQ